MNNLVYNLFYAAIWLVTWPPLRVLYLISGFSYFIMYYIIGYRRKVVYANLRNAFPHKSQDEIATIARKFYRHFCDMFIEMAKRTHCNVHEMRHHVGYKNIVLLNELNNQGKHIVLISGHYGTWEWLLELPSRLNHPFVVLYKPSRNRYFDRFLKEERERFRPVMVPANDVLKVLIEAQRKQQRYTIWFLADQTPSPEGAYWTNFLNQETAVYQGAERVARKFDCAVVYMNITRLRRGYYEVDFETLFEAAGQTAKFEISEAHTRKLEQNIIERPEYWLWSHRRWKHKKAEDFRPPPSSPAAACDGCRRDREFSVTLNK